MQKIGKWIILLSIIPVFLLLTGCSSSKERQATSHTTTQEDRIQILEKGLVEDNEKWVLLDKGAGGTLSYAPGSVMKDKDGNVSVFVRTIPNKPGAKVGIITVDLAKEKGFFKDTNKIRVIETIVLDAQGKALGAQPTNSDWTDVSEVTDKDAKANFEKLFSDLKSYF
ncbi:MULTISPECIES: hypothetical protein [Pelosinus]|uniref:Lipoprotein n=1 Tax=Pelosinus fermentans B4 TaxID=1149862 RepID=I9LGG4_9FIRM|nr:MULTISPECIES: hypothetical protein [Pelosinus]EIW19594.1 hypothetical protein FB4_2777 [Pelosinus fermentans B4]EIW24672.1 hypothetical protein FA11_3063 [Pelosinus fermentans A11]OAM96047.1 hypothetical protein FR7_04069 [Pelosinus fermentans DSM 17108]SDR35750.1 hypothetical protein SAMN04515679_4238 [Pelosinus fermentans]